MGRVNEGWGLLHATSGAFSLVTSGDFSLATDNMAATDALPARA